MNATDELRRMLDERGAEWGNVRNDGSESDYLTEWQFEDNQGKAIATEWAVGSGLSVEIHRYHLTPEQAIAATLGAGTCQQEEGGWSTEGDHARVWLTCGHDCMVETVADLPNFCPICGAKVVDA